MGTVGTGLQKASSEEYEGYTTYPLMLVFQREDVDDSDMHYHSHTQLRGGGTERRLNNRQH